MARGNLVTSATWEETSGLLRLELSYLGVRGLIQSRALCALQSSVTLMIEGKPLTCGKFRTPEQNLRALFQVVQTLRKAKDRDIDGLLLKGAELISNLPVPVSRQVRQA